MFYVIVALMFAGSVIVGLWPRPNALSTLVRPTMGACGLYYLFQWLKFNKIGGATPYEVLDHPFYGAILLFIIWFSGIIFLFLDFNRNNLAGSASWLLLLIATLAGGAGLAKASGRPSPFRVFYAPKLAIAHYLSQPCNTRARGAAAEGSMIVCLEYKSLCYQEKLIFIKPVTLVLPTQDEGRARAEDLNQVTRESNSVKIDLLGGYYYAGSSFPC
jgi:hypothetical protein